MGPFWFAAQVWDALASEAIRLVREQHQRYPLRSGLSKEEWRARLTFSSKMATEIFTALQAEGKLEVVPETGAGYARETTSRTGGLIRLPGFLPSFSAAQQRQVERVLQSFQKNPFTPPGRAEIEAMADAEVINALIEQGRLVKLIETVLFLRETYEEAVTKLIAYLREHGKMTAAEARDVLGATRKYILPLLEHMDALHITRRIGNDRVLGIMAPDVSMPSVRDADAESTIQ